MIKITDADISKVMYVTSVMHEVRYMPARKSAFTDIVSELNASELWLLSFFAWFCLWNSKFRSIDPSRYHYVPVADENNATFDSFLKLIRRYEDVNITRSREAALVRFISACDKPHRDLFLDVLSKDWIKIFPMLEVQTLLSIDDISSDIVYGDIEYIKTSFSELSYPVAIRAIPEGASTICVVSKEPSYCAVKYRDDYELKPAKLTEEIKLDMGISINPRYTIAGVSDGHNIYPFDFFNSWAECNKYLSKEEIETPYPIRVYNILNFTKRNLTINVDSSPIVVIRDEDDLRDALIKVVGSMKLSELLISDAQSLATGKVFRVTCRVSLCKIDSIWLENDEPMGFIAWFNGERIKCIYSFDEKENAILSNLSIIKGLLMDMYYIVIGEKDYFIGKSLLWGAQGWRTRKLRGTDIEILGCALCGDVRWSHANRGICKSCESNMPYYFNKYGPNVWIEPSLQMKRKRWRSSWKYSVLNKVGYKHKGTILEAKESGEWMFKKEV